MWIIRGFRVVGYQAVSTRPTAKMGRIPLLVSPTGVFAPLEGESGPQKEGGHASEDAPVEKEARASISARLGLGLGPRVGVIDAGVEVYLFKQRIILERTWVALDSLIVQAVQVGSRTHGGGRPVPDHTVAQDFGDTADREHEAA